MADYGVSQAAAGDSDQKPDKMDTDSADESQCYCGKGRDLLGIELQCGMCNKFFHTSCVECSYGTVVPFMINYQFFCKNCGSESFTKKQASFNQMCYTAVANLTLQNLDKPDALFSRDKDIIPYIDKHWESMTTQPRRVKTTWHTTVAKTLSKDSDIFIGKEDIPGDPCYALKSKDLSRIGPNYETLLKVSGSSLKAEQRSSTSTTDTRGSRGAKRKTLGENQTVTSRTLKKGEVGLVGKMAPVVYPTEHPYNKDGYRYILAEPDPHAPNRQAFDESMEWAGKPIPPYLYRTFLGQAVKLALHDRAPQLKISNNRMTVTGDRGYSMIRATHGINKGSWYYEVNIQEMPVDSATRIGWAQQLGNLQAPCGYDKFSYSWRSVKGTVFHQSRGKHYSEGYVEGDTIGFYFHMPQPDDPSKLLPATCKDKPLVKFKSHLYYEEKDYVAEAEKKLIPVKGSKMVMYKNGENQGVAFQDIFAGTYYPATSCYKNSVVTFNFGPDFKFPPKDIKSYKPFSQAAEDAFVENTLGDMLYHIEHEGNLPEF